MPTNNPRVHVTIAPATDLLLQRMTVVTGQSKSEIIRGLLETAEPALGRVVALMTASKGAQQAMLQNLAVGLDQAQTKMEGVLNEALKQADRAVGDLVAQAESVRARKPAGAGALAHAPVGVVTTRRRAAAQNPPASNRGVKSPRRHKASGQTRGVK